MTNKDKLILSSYVVKQAYANYLTAGGDSYSPDPVIRGLATHNLGENTSNMTTNHLAKTQAFAPPAPTPKKDPNTMFKTYMGTEYNPKSRVDKNKLKLLQSLLSEGMNLEDVKGNQADIYKRMKGMKF
jgi:hypothetical protein